MLARALKVDRRLPVLVVARCLDMSCYLEAMQLALTPISNSRANNMGS